MVTFLLILGVVFFVTGVACKILSEQMNQKAAFYDDIVTILKKAEADLAFVVKENRPAQDPVAVWGCAPCRRANLINDRCAKCGVQMKVGDPTAIIGRLTYERQR